MKIISNSTPIITLAKLNALDLLAEYTVYVPSGVREEVLAKECAEKDRIIHFLRQKNVHIVTPTEKHPTSTILGKGEMDTIHLAKEQKISIVLMDDRRARSHVKLHGLVTRGTIWIILQAYRRKRINRQKAKKYMYRLSETGFYIGEEFLMRILEEIDT